MYELFLKIIEFVESFGYLGIFIMTFIEGSFIPIPSEITLIPAGFLIAKGEFGLWPVLFWSLTGTLGGALLNYFIALHFGRALFIKYGKYFFLTPKKLKKIETFFDKHGPISAFTGRMLPGLKHFISFPAGLGRMNIKLFTLYSAAGAVIWISLLLFIGHSIGDNEVLIKKNIQYINIGLLVFVAILVGAYIIKVRLNYKGDKGK